MLGEVLKATLPYLERAAGAVHSGLLLYKLIDLVCSVVVDCVLRTVLSLWSLTNGNTLQLATPYKIKHCQLTSPNTSGHAVEHPFGRLICSCIILCKKIISVLENALFSGKSRQSLI